MPRKTRPNQLPDRKRVLLLRRNRFRIEIPLLTGRREPKIDPIKIALLPSPIDMIRIDRGRVQLDLNITGRLDLKLADLNMEEPGINQDRIRAGRLVDSLAGLMEKDAPRERREETTVPLNRGPDPMIRIVEVRHRAGLENKADRLMVKAVLLRRDNRPVQEPGDQVVADLLRPDQVSLSSVLLFRGREALPQVQLANRLEKEARPKRPLANPGRGPIGAPNRKISGTILVPRESQSIKSAVTMLLFNRPS